MTKLESWSSDLSYIYEETYSIDGGKTFKSEMEHTLLASYFFASNEDMMHSREVHNIL